MGVKVRLLGRGTSGRRKGKGKMMWGEYKYDPSTL
jgi:hypothetical protein